MSRPSTTGDFDTLVTFTYKHGFVHIKYDRVRNEEVVSYQLPGHAPVEVKSIRAAKCTITRSQK